MPKEKDELLYRKRIMELANLSYYKDYATYSDFLDLNEQSIFHQMLQELPNVHYVLWGGNALAERKMLCFSNETPEEEYFPIRMIKIRPAHIKYAEKLSHRDYLGAILNLGIDRGKLGDIMFEDEDTYVFVEETMKDYVLTSLEKVKHTKVVCEEVFEQKTFERKYKEINGTVSSIRLDAIIAVAFGSSRSKLLGMIEVGKVFVNGVLVTSNSYRLKEGDIVSVRGMGKFVFEHGHEMTKKGKMKVLLRKYV